MRKFLFIAVVLFGGAMFLKGNVSLTADNQLHVAAWTFLSMAAGTNFVQPEAPPPPAGSGSGCRSSAASVLIVLVVLIAALVMLR